MAVMLRLAADDWELLHRKQLRGSPDAGTVVWLCPTSKQELKGNKE